MASDNRRTGEESFSDVTAPAETAGRVLSHADKLRLESLRYATRREAETYVAIMRTFTGGISGLLSDQSAAEVRQRLIVEHSIELDLDIVDVRLSRLVELGNLARSPREAEARSIKEYLQHRARYQLTQRGEAVHRMVEELLQRAETAHEVSSEMLGGILEGLWVLNRIETETLAELAPDEVARRITTLFAQFERLVDSTRDFYTYLSEVLRRFDLNPDEFKAYKNLLIDYLHRFVEEIGLHMPQIGEEIITLWPSIDALVDQANAGQRLVGLDGTRARRDRGLDVGDWPSLALWFLGEPGREADAVQVRGLATQAMNALLSNLRRIVADGTGERSRHQDLVTLARWFGCSDDAGAHALWVAAFGLYPARHLGFRSDREGASPSPTTSWWQGPTADVPVTLRNHGDRTVRGRVGKPADYSTAKRRRIEEREAVERRRRAALAELEQWSGGQISDDARAALLDLYGAALLSAGGPLAEGERTSAYAETGLCLVVRSVLGGHTVINSPQGRLELVDLALEIVPAAGASEGSRAEADR
ncbi:TIGR02677 family protein [Sciscionella marina]|uniref:TIGR02677 family protein n=1 Tax=Sciscionella marina TaxID=508770 RepID=UPI00039E60E9|nr:TIGR02677 family protein [Sciscionella marina]